MSYDHCQKCGRATFYQTLISGQCRRCRDKATRACAPKCQHCGIKPANRPRGLCSEHYADREVRECYAVISDDNSGATDERIEIPRPVQRPCRRCGTLIETHDCGLEVECDSPCVLSITKCEYEQQLI